MEDLPRIPGYSFPLATDQDYKLKQKLNYSNGCRVICDSNIGIGRRPVDASSSAFAQEIPQEPIFDPSLIYGRRKGLGYCPVIPHYVQFAQKCLNFKAFFRENVYNSQAEQYRIRHVNIIYYLEDDTLAVREPPVDNAGFKQGKLVMRARIPKNKEDFYHWKDLNIGVDITIYGRTYHTVDADAFTKEFLRSQGIDVGEQEEPPSDSYTRNRQENLNEHEIRAASSAVIKTKRAQSAPKDSLRRLLQYDGMILTFDASWNDDFYQILYFLTDDTIAVKETLGCNSGKDPVRMLLKRTRIPKNWGNMPQTFPSIYLEQGEEDVDEYYSPLDLKVGQTLSIFNRRFLLFDCDPFTRNYYRKYHNIDQPPRISSESALVRPKTCNETLTAKSFTQKERRNKDDVIRKLVNHPKKLRYLASMVAGYREDRDREFVIEYNLADGKIKIHEISKKNSGHRAGCFLASMYVPKPRSLQKCSSSSKKPFKNDTDLQNDDNDDDDDIRYYTPEDFFIGAQINVFNHRFVINGADLFVLHYIEANPDKFPADLLENMQSYFDESQRSEKNERNERNVKRNQRNDDNYQEPIFPAETNSDAAKMISNLQDSNGDGLNGDYKCIGNDTTNEKHISFRDQGVIPAICNN